MRFPLSLAAFITFSLAAAGKPEEKPKDPDKSLSPEAIMEGKIEGKVTVEFLVGDAQKLDFDSVFMPGRSHLHIIKAKTPAAKDGKEFVVIVSRETATRLLRLGIEDPAAHFRGKVMKVSGIVERMPRPMGLQYRILVTHLDQLESIRKP